MNRDYLKQLYFPEHSDNSEREAPDRTLRNDIARGILMVMSLTFSLSSSWWWCSMPRNT